MACLQILNGSKTWNPFSSKLRHNDSWGGKSDWLHYSLYFRACGQPFTRIQNRCEVGFNPYRCCRWKYVVWSLSWACAGTYEGQHYQEVMSRPSISVKRDNSIATSRYCRTIYMPFPYISFLLIAPSSIWLLYPEPTVVTTAWGQANGGSQ